MTKSSETKIGLAILKEQMEQNNKDHSEIKNLICELKKDLNEFKEDCDERYAPKWVATFVYAIVIIIVSGLLGGAITQLYK